MNTMEQYYNVKVQVAQEQDSGKIKTAIEAYLVKAVSVTDAEVKITEDFKGYPLDWKVKSVTATKIIKVIE